MARLKNYLDEHPVQVLLGIHSKALPDRGTLRKLDQIAAHAKDGLIVQLLSDADLTHDDEPVDKQAVRYQQWQTALSARKIGLVTVAGFVMNCLQFQIKNNQKQCISTTCS